MNEQPQPHDLQHQDGHEGNEPMYRASNTAAQSSFSGYDLTTGPQPNPTMVPAPFEPAPQTQDDDLPNALTWEASEYIHHTKSGLWYLGYIAAMALLLAVAYFMTQSWTFMALVVVMAIAIGVFASRPPRTLHYSLTDQGIQIENTVYRYSDFRAFGVLADGALYSVMLIPTKRFMPAVNMYFAEEDGEDIVDILGTRLPMQELHLDALDRLVRRLRF